MDNIGHPPRRDRGAVRLSLVLMGLMVVAIGALAYFIGWKGAEDARASEAWPTVPGAVLSSEVRVSPDPEGGHDYAPIVQYAYSVDGKEYRASRISFGRHNSGDQGAVERKIASLPVGATVAVAYDPTDHGRAVLEPGQEGLNFIVKLIGIGTGIGGLVMVVGALYFGRRSRSHSGLAHLTK